MGASFVGKSTKLALVLKEKYVSNMLALINFLTTNSNASKMLLK